MRRIIRAERVKLPNVQRLNKKGVLHKYHRQTRAKLPSDIPEDHPTFISAWSAEEATKSTPAAKAKSGTIAHGCEAYLASGEYRDLSEGYRPVIRRHVEAIKYAYGPAKMADLRTRHIDTDIDPLTPAVAKSRRKGWRKIVPFWYRKGWVATDMSLAAQSKKLKKSDGHKEWSQKDVDTFRAFWPVDTPQRHAMELLQWTGARASDAVRLGHGMIDQDGLLSFKQVKTRAMAYVPWFGPAQGMEAQRQTLLNYPTPHMVFLVTAHHKARSVKAFSQWFSKSATDAGLPELSAHGLRKYRMNQLAENSCSVLQMQSWVGHLTLSEVELYTRRVDRRRAFIGTEQVQNLVNHPTEFTKNTRK